MSSINRKMPQEHVENTNKMMMEASRRAFVVDVYANQLKTSLNLDVIVSRSAETVKYL